MVGCLHSENICQLKDVVFNRKSYFAEHIVIDGKVGPLSRIHSYLKDSFSAMELQDMLEYYPDDILVKVDRAGMAVSLENRIPMLDKDVIEFAWTLPSEYKYQKGVSKKILRNILYKYVPSELLERPKQGFCVPMEKWLLQGDTHEWAKELVYHSTLVDDNYLDKSVVKSTWEKFQQDQSGVRLLWNFLMAEQWYRSINFVPNAL